jgi:hypothetical protein
LRIRLFKVSEESRVGECLHARGVVCHDVQGSCEVVGFVEVAVFALVGALHVAEVCGRGLAGDRALGDPGDCGGVVRAAGDRGVGHVMVVCHEHDLSEETRVFEVTVGDDAGPVVGGDQFGLDLGREGTTPDVREAFGAVIYAAHPGLGCVGGADEARVLRDDLREVRGSVAQARRQGGEGSQMVPQAGVDPDPTTGGLVERDL